MFGSISRCIPTDFFLELFVGRIVQIAGAQPGQLIHHDVVLAAVFLYGRLHPAGVDVKQRLFVIPGQFGEIGVFIGNRHGNAAQQTALHHHRDQIVGCRFPLAVNVPGVFAVYDMIDRRVAVFAIQLPFCKALAGHRIQRIDAAAAGHVLVLVRGRIRIAHAKIYALMRKRSGWKGFFCHDVFPPFLF